MSAAGVEVKETAVNIRVFCDTQNGGRRYLEAFPLDEAIRPRSRGSTDTVDQEWKIELLTNGKVVLSCNTTNRGWKAMEAFPQQGVCRPTEPDYRNAEQLWTVEPAGHDRYHLHCQTANRGLRALEAFPNEDTVQPSPPDSSAVDQRWQFDPLPSFIRNNVALSAELYDFQFPDFREVLTAAMGKVEGHIDLKSAFLDTYEIGEGALGLVSEKKWSREVHTEYTFESSFTIGGSVSTVFQLDLPFVGGTKTKLTFEASGTETKTHRTSTTETVEKTISFRPETPGVYKVGSFLVGLDGIKLEFTATIRYTGKGLDGKEVGVDELKNAIRAQEPNVRIDSLSTEEGANGLIGTITGMMHAKAALSSVIVAEKLP